MISPSTLFLSRRPEVYDCETRMLLTVSSIGETYSRCGPLEPLKVFDLGRPPFLPMRSHSNLVSSASVGIRASEALMGSQIVRTLPMYGAFFQAVESGRGVGRVLKPGFAAPSFPGERASDEYRCGVLSQRTLKSYRFGRAACSQRLWSSWPRRRAVSW